MSLPLHKAIRFFLTALLLVGFRVQAQERESNTGAAFPLKVSRDGRHLAAPDGRPFLYHADTCWKLFLKLTEAEAGEYLKARREQEFNVVQVMLTGFYERGVNETNRAGEKPFLGSNDFAQPNEAYFAHVDKVIKQAQSLNLVLAIAPLWAGCCGEGWAGKDHVKQPKPMNANGPAKCRAFGRWLGARYGAFPNILWIMGGDNDPHESREEMRQLALGLKEAAPHQLITYHAASSHSSTDVWAGELWLDVSMVYTYFRGFNKAWNKNQPDVYEVCRLEYAKDPMRPFFLGESTYEGEHGAWGSAWQARKQAYWAVLSGATGHAYGSPIWNVPPNWREVLRLPGAQTLRFLPRLMHLFPWHRLKPDFQNMVAVAGQGTYATNDYTTTAIAADGSFALSYLASPRPLSIDLSRFAGPVQASWYDPTDGSFRSAVAGTLRNEGRQTFTPPARNAAGDPDFVLLMETDSARTVPKQAKVNARELIRDPRFQAGAILLDPKPGSRVPYGILPGLEISSEPVWDLCQWSSRFPLVTNSSPGQTAFTNETKAVIFGRPGTENPGLVLDVHATAEYGPRVRRAGEPWVHLLVQQQFSDAPVLSSLDQARFRINLRLRHSLKFASPEYSPDHHAAQFQVFFTLQNLNRQSPGFGRLVWFGVPLYDDRSRFPRAHKAQDTGGTSMFIYTPPGETFTDASAHDGGWIKVDKDLLPLFKEALASAWKSGFLTESKNLADYRISGMNMGWELPGTFDVGAEIRNLSLWVTSRE